MRKLIVDDMLYLSEIIDKIDIKIPETKFVDKMTDEELKQAKYQAGMDLIYLLLRKIYKAKKEVYAFLASLLDISEDEVKKIPLSEIKDIFIEILNNEDFLSFFKQGNK